jgi:hypothetical protein
VQKDSGIRDHASWASVEVSMFSHKDAANKSGKHAALRNHCHACLPDLVESSQEYLFIKINTRGTLWKKKLRPATMAVHTRKRKNPQAIKKLAPVLRNI